ncbi:MAG TPA: hypothetical protein VFE63_17810 [Roseiarcus sp.]|nr:hypothetical protein [Roseiarcus sp.]
MNPALRIFISVDLPAPFSPTIAWTSPARTPIETSLRTSIGRNERDNPTTSRTGWAERKLSLNASATACDRPAPGCGDIPSPSSTVRRRTIVGGADGSMLASHLTPENRSVKRPRCSLAPHWRMRLRDCG